MRETPEGKRRPGNHDPSSGGLALAILRTLRGWSQKELAVAAHLRPAAISAYERGRQPLPTALLRELTGRMGFPSALLRRTLALVEAARRTREGSAHPGDPLARLRHGLEDVVATVAERTADFADGLIRQVLYDLRAMEDRRRAVEDWEGMIHLPPPRQRERVERKEVGSHWALCETLCAESVKAAADDADRAAHLAELALLAAAGVQGGEAWRSRVQGYAWAHLANARRVRGDLRGAETAFQQADRLWTDGAAGDPGFLNETRLLDLKASLRKDQRRLDEALTLLDRALVARPEPTSLGRLLMNKANVLEKLGENERAIAVLRDAAPRIDEGTDPRLKLGLRFNLLVNLCAAGRYSDADELFRSEHRKLQTWLGGELDVLRLQWLRARIQAGLGNRGEAAQLLEDVRSSFIARGLACDSALVTLELAILCMEDGRLAGTSQALRQVVAILRDQSVRQETLAALHVLVQATEQETATLQLARQTLERLRQDLE